MTKFFYLFFIFCTFSYLVVAQQDSVSNQKRTFLTKVVDFLEIQNKADKQNDTSRFRMKLIMSPVVSYTPETSWGAGVGMKLLFKPKHTGAETRTSNVPISVIYTLRNQLIIGSGTGFNIFSKHENWLLKGNINISKFPVSFFGIGNNTPLSNEQIVEYKNILLEPLLLKRVVGKLFLGLGFRYNHIWDVSHDYINENQQPADSLVGYFGSTSIGLQAAITFDSRNNILNATKGSLWEFRHNFHGDQFNGIPFESTLVDLRKYFLLSKRKTIVLAMQAYSYFSESRAPFLELASIGGKELMRGFYAGRFRDKNALAAQAEIRFPIKKPFGMVIFGGAGQVYDKRNEIHIDNLHYSYGVGARLQIVKSENLNLRFDIAKGEKIGYYFGIAEAF